MQKKFIALAVAAALVPAAAMADTTVYGRIHASVDSVTGMVNNKNSLSVNSSSSRFGVKGSEDLGGGLKAVYQLESGINAINNNNNTASGGAGDGNPSNPADTTHISGSLFTGMRTSYLGLAGDFGTFLVGRLPAGEQYVYDSNLFADQIGDAANLLAGGAAGYIGGRANSTLHYITPNLNGFDAALTYLPASSVDASTGLAAGSGSASWGVKANYAAMGAAVHVTYFNVKPIANVKLTPLSIAGSYDFGPGMVTAQYVRNNLAVAGNPDVKQNTYNIGGTYKVMPNGTVKAQYSKANASTGANDGATQFAVGYDYDLSKRTGVYLAYSQTNNDAGGSFATNGYGHGGNAVVALGEDPRAISIGLTHNF